MNYKDPENILVIVCSAMGIGALAILIRYLFIRFGYDSFSANIVFIIAFLIGVIVFITYLEFIQKIASRFTKNKLEVSIEPTESIESKQLTEIIEEPKPDLNSIREKHFLEQQEHKERLFETALEYTRTTFAPYADDENIERLCGYITDYYNAIDLKGNKSVRGKRTNHLRPLPLRVEYLESFSPYPKKQAGRYCCIP